MTLYSELLGEGASDGRRLVHLERDQTRPSLPCATRNALTRSAPVWWCSSKPTSCDVIIATERALLVPAFGRLGLVPEVGTGWLLTRRLGYNSRDTLALRPMTTPRTPRPARCVCACRR